MTQSPMDLFSQCAFLDPDLLGYDNFYAFQARYAIMKRMNMGAHSFNHIVGYRNMDELSLTIKSFRVAFSKRLPRLTAKDIHDTKRDARSRASTAVRIDAPKRDGHHE